MSRRGQALCLVLLTALAAALPGCRRAPASRAPESLPAKDQPSFQQGKGLFLPDATRQAIGLQLAEAGERRLSRRLSTEVEVYDPNGGGLCHASGLVSGDQAALLHPGQAVKLTSQDGHTVEGKVERLREQAQPGSGQAEVLVTAPAAARGTLGAFFTASLSITNEPSTPCVPSSALLRAAQGDFVYVVHAEYLLRTEVKVGNEGDGFVQIRDGVHTGDKVAATPVQVLWLTELRLTTASGAD